MLALIAQGNERSSRIHVGGRDRRCSCRQRAHGITHKYIYLLFGVTYRLLCLKTALTPSQPDLYHIVYWYRIIAARPVFYTGIRPLRALVLHQMGSKSVTIDMTGEPEVQPKRHFPPLYKSTGDSSSDRLAFFHVLERLKVRASIFHCL